MIATFSRTDFHRIIRATREQAEPLNLYISNFYSSYFEVIQPLSSDELVYYSVTYLQMLFRSYGIIVVIVCFGVVNAVVFVGVGFGVGFSVGVVVVYFLNQPVLPLKD